MTTFAGVIRVSHMGSRKAGDENVHTDRDQVADLERGAQQHGARLVLLPPELGVSGGLPLEKRPSLLQAIEGVEAGRFDGIIVAYLSRLGRNVREQLRAWDRVEAAGGRIIVVQEGIDTSTPHGRLQRNILMSVDEHYREEHAERFDNLRRWATEAGIWQRRQTPTGYERDETTRRLVPDARAGEIRPAFVARAAGLGATELGQRLRMTPTGARRLIANRVYLGELTVGPYTNPAAHPALVDEDLWLAAQKPVSVRRPRGGGEPALLAGLVRCCGCGHVMGRGRTKVTIYRCPVHHSEGRCPAPAAITAALLDEHVGALALAALTGLRDRPAANDTAFEQARTTLRACERELALYLETVTAVGLGAAEFGAGARSRQQAVQDARHELEVALGARTTPIPAKVLDDWPRMTAQQRNRLLRSLIEVVLVRRSGGRGMIVALESRVRVLRHGAGVAPGAYRGGGKAVPVRTIALPELDDVRVLGA